MPLDEVATRMVESHFTVVPLIQSGQLNGELQKPCAIRATLFQRTARV